MDDAPRPSCNCKTSQCIQRYCQCFGNQWYCSDACRCESCFNTEAREAFVEERAELVFRRRPGAALARSNGGGSTCTCRKSECKKNYCACFKNRAACSERCQCQGCANTHGAKPGAVLLHDNGDSSGASASDGGDSTLSDGSNGTSSDETAVITDEGSLSPTESSLAKEIYATFGEPSNICQHGCESSDSNLVAFLNSLPDRDCFSQNVHTLMDQAAMHSSANSTPQDLLEPNINSGTQDGPCGN